MPTRRHLALAAAALATPARAQDGPVTLVVPFTPGTGMDILARLFSPYLQRRLEHPVVVDNRPGASGNIGSQAVGRAQPDGRTLMVHANTFVTNVPLFTPAPYDPIRGFTPIILLTDGDLVLCTNMDVQAATPAQLVELAKRQPIDYASPGIGTPQHLAMALFGLEAKVELNHIPYRGSAPALQDLVGKRVHAMAMPITTALPLAAQGRIRMMAVGSPQRAPTAPDVPTFAEAGFPGVQVGFWYPVFGPPNMAPALVDRFNLILNEWLREPETAARLRDQGMSPRGGTPQVLADLVREDLARWTRVIREAKITAE
jgi:tripartite-type tricarboxylate transporter receptor subunit TctC